MTAIFDKDHVIDRRAELDTFSEFVLRTRGGRLLAFHAEKFDGKTMLMERLSYAARKELLGDDGPPTVLVVVDPDEPLPDLIDRLANSLKVIANPHRCFDDGRGPRQKCHGRDRVGERD